MSQTNPFTALLAAQPFVLLDGAMATELEARGCRSGRQPVVGESAAGEPAADPRCASRLLSRRGAGGDHRQLSGHSGGLCPRAGWMRRSPVR